jgi:50S ribosomal protein L16 3-hydroxylase
MSEQLHVLGGLTAKQFLAEYWQKKPLLVRNALPELVGLFEPEDIQQLALEDDVSARLISQHGSAQQQWRVKNAPLKAKDFQALPQFWTLLVQAVDHYSLDLAALWHKFDFLPLWRRDDIMVSYAPKGGSVGQHFDFYDVFLVQGFGHRRWQLGQTCDEDSAIVAGQPLKLLSEMHLEFEALLAPGDLLYVPPRMAHYGVAEDDCLTFSFGFRMPNPAQLLDRFSDQVADHHRSKTPLPDLSRQPVLASAEVAAGDIAHIKQQLLQAMSQHPAFEAALMGLISEAKYPDHIGQPDLQSAEQLQDYAEQGMVVALDPANRLLYRQLPDAQFEFWGNGEALCLHPASVALFQQLANGEQLALERFLQHPDCTADLAEALNAALLMLIEAD